MKELNFYLKTTASAYKCFQKPYQDVHLLNWVTCNLDCGVMWFRNEPWQVTWFNSRADCEVVQLSCACVAWNKMLRTKLLLVAFICNLIAVVV